MTDLDDEAALVWAEEAERRGQAMEDGSEPEIPAEEVFARVRTLVEEVQQAQREYEAGLYCMTTPDELLAEILEGDLPGTINAVAFRKGSLWIAQCLGA